MPDENKIIAFFAAKPADCVINISEITKPETRYEFLDKLISIIQSGTTWRLDPPFDLMLSEDFSKIIKTDLAWILKQPDSQSTPSTSTYTETASENISEEKVY